MRYWPLGGGRVVSGFITVAVMTTPVIVNLALDSPRSPVIDVESFAVCQKDHSTQSCLGRFPPMGSWTDRLASHRAGPGAVPLNLHLR